MSKIVKIIIGLVVVALVVGVGYWSYSGEGGQGLLRKASRFTDRSTSISNKAKVSTETTPTDSLPDPEYGLFVEKNTSFKNIPDLFLYGWSGNSNNQRFQLGSFTLDNTRGLHRVTVRELDLYAEYLQSLPDTMSTDSLYAPVISWVMLCREGTMCENAADSYGAVFPVPYDGGWEIRRFGSSDEGYGVFHRNGGFSDPIIVEVGEKVVVDIVGRILSHCLITSGSNNPSKATFRFAIKADSMEGYGFSQPSSDIKLQRITLLGDPAIQCAT